MVVETIMKIVSNYYVPKWISFIIANLFSVAYSGQVLYFLNLFIGL